MISLIRYFLIHSCFFCLVSIAVSGAAENRQNVTIGLIYPLSGPMASFGSDMARALPLLENKFNSEQSKYNFKLIIEDGKFGHSNSAITAARKMVDLDRVRFMVIGSSGELLQAAPYLESSKVLSVAGFSCHPDVRNAGDYIFRTYFDCERGIRLVADDILAKGYQRIAVISEEAAFTLSIKTSLDKFLHDRIVLSEDYAFGDSDFKTLVAKARSKNPQAYYLNTATPANFITLLKQLRENGVKEPFYTYYVPSLKDVQQNLGSQLNGTIYLDYPSAEAISDDFKSFQTLFEKQYGKTIAAPFNFRTNYNAVKVIFDAIMQVGSDPTEVKNYLYTYDKASAAGRLRFDSNGDAKDLNLVLKVFDGN